MMLCCIICVNQSLALRKSLNCCQRDNASCQNEFKRGYALSKTFFQQKLKNKKQKLPLQVVEQKKKKKLNNFDL